MKIWFILKLPLLALMIMEKLPNVNQILLDEIRDLRRIVELALLNKANKVDTIDIFDLKGQKKAAKVLNMDVKTLHNRIKEGKLKENIHYRVTVSKSGRKRYSFNKNALLSTKGLI